MPFEISCCACQASEIHSFQTSEWKWRPFGQISRDNFHTQPKTVTFIRFGSVISDDWQDKWYDLEEFSPPCLPTTGILKAPNSKYVYFSGWRSGVLFHVVYCSNLKHRATKWWKLKSKDWQITCFRVRHWDRYLSEFDFFEQTFDWHPV